MFEWKCPHCGKKFYSSSAVRETEFIDCCYCARLMDNPYYKKDEKDDGSKN